MPALRHLPNLRLSLGALVFLSTLTLPVLSHAAGEAGSCKYVPIAKIDVDYSDRTRRVVVTGTINGTQVPMMMDTGAYETLLLRNGADRLGLRLEATGKYSYGLAGATITYRTHVNDFSLGASHTGRTVVPVIDVPGEKRNEAIVGADYLLQTDMELSLADKYMQFFRASGCDDTYLAYWDQNAMEIPFIGKEGKSNKPFVTVELNGVKMKAMLDTGAPRTTIGRHAAEQAGINVNAPEVHKIGQSGGIGHELRDNWVADFKSFKIGDETVNNPHMIIRDDPPQGEGQVDVLLGIDFLRVHHILFAMSQHKLYMSYLGGSLFGAGEEGPQVAKQVPKAP
ncbi:retroviral-like aspartic protease family protein [Massilia sp. 9096]|uniref:retroviral-like aspartic protease family protein n=1 Tax=Massilia sp. 9096 TaxID=1500894 RepID=UPI00055C836D|nr:retroviral-like aspartic protease family protein [Massilia sp. 9096]